MYATSESSKKYHLLYPGLNYTLCGFRAEKPDLVNSEKAALHLVHVVPPGRELCKQCDKMDKRRKRASLRSDSDCERQKTKMRA
jgi:hypothetical protein